jgi:hypothetical protein
MIKQMVDSNIPFRKDKNDDSKKFAIRFTSGGQGRRTSKAKLENIEEDDLDDQSKTNY